METIKHPRIEVVPSWSWMAYTGEICFGRLNEEGLSWCDGIKLDTANNRLEAPLVQIGQDCHTEQREGTNHKIRDGTGGLVGWIRYDCEGKKEKDGIESLGCIAIARNNAFSGTTWTRNVDVGWNEELIRGTVFHVLLVTCTSLGQGHREVYRRLGVAVIYAQHLSSRKPQPTVWVK